jgi:hypothetical protein
VRLYPKGAKEWGEVITRFDGLDTNWRDGKPDVVVTPEKAEDDLAVWLESVELDETEKAKEREHMGAGLCSEHTHGHHPNINRKVSADRVTLYRCSWCGNPSAALRKCSGCAMARFVVDLGSFLLGDANLKTGTAMLGAKSWIGLYTRSNVSGRQVDIRRIYMIVCMRTFLDG